MQLQDCRTYHRNECAVFLKTAEQFGGLSNMAGGYPLVINGIRIFTSEALYQACRFPYSPDVQQLIIDQKSPMAAKMKSKPYRREKSRRDWDDVRVQVMRWCLRVKLVQHWEKFGSLLLSTGDKHIVEESYRDQFWGAKPIDEETLRGANVLGRLLEELRNQLKGSEAQKKWVVEPPHFPDFLLLNKKIGSIETVKWKPISVPGATHQELSDLELSSYDDNGNNTTEVNALAKLDHASSPISVDEVSLSNSSQLYLFGP